MAQAHFTIACVYVDPAKKAIVVDAYRRVNGSVAYLDESYQTFDTVVDPAATFYIFAAVIVQADQRDELRAGLLEIAGGDWWHTSEALLQEEGRAKTRDMLEFLAEGPEMSIIGLQVPVGDHDRDGEIARRDCYRGLAIELATGRDGLWDPVELLVLEERNQSNFRNKDRRNHVELVSEKSVPRNTRLLQTSPSAEQLLWLPDLVSAVYRRTLTHRDRTRHLFDVIRPKVHLMQS